ncbi:uncharacterized protein LOC134907221 [Pseudophryne corroboree]|uniref:uncharacterized protein LOC134907221 n=1 Tax=Pseudophryne corroboree TaxID=495146 RepID=UPI0030817168
MDLNKASTQSDDVKAADEDTKNSCDVGSKDTDEGAKKSCDVETKATAVPARSPGYIKCLLLRISCIWPLKYVFKMLKKVVSFAGLSEEVETVGSAEQTSPNRRFLSGKKRIGRLARLILLITPYRLQCALGYRSVQNLGKTSASDDIRKSPLKLHGKGSKRKQDDLDMEEQHSWVTFMTEDLPDEDQVDDPTYEPSNSETDSEENKSKNDTESDLEVEEKDGVVMLKEATQETQGTEEQIHKSPCEESNPDGEEQKTTVSAD